MLPPRRPLCPLVLLFFPLLFLLSVLVPGQPSTDGLLEAAAAAGQAAAAAAPLTHSAAGLGGTGLAAVGRPGGKALVWVVHVEGVLSATHTVSFCTAQVRTRQRKDNEIQKSEQGKQTRNSTRQMFLWHATFRF